jgi:hypothetical protein
MCAGACKRVLDRALFAFVSSPTGQPVAVAFWNAGRSCNAATHEAVFGNGARPSGKPMQRFTIGPSAMSASEKCVSATHADFASWPSSI